LVCLGRFERTAACTFSCDGCKSRNWDDQSIEVHLHPINKKNRVQTSLFQQVGKYTQVGNGPITTYNGVLQFDEPGQWQVEILGEKTIINVKR
jgi:hypothetical protein